VKMAEGHLPCVGDEAAGHVHGGDVDACSVFDLVWRSLGAAVAVSRGLGLKQ